MIEEQDSLAQMDIQHFILSDGAEVIGYINSMEGAMVLVERPMLLGKVKNGEFDTFFFTRYMPFSEGNIIKINSRNIISTCQVRTDIKERYILSALRPDNYHEEEPIDDDLVDMESPSKVFH